jgi:hypothetical protein
MRVANERGRPKHIERGKNQQGCPNTHTLYFSCNEASGANLNLESPRRDKEKTPARSTRRGLLVRDKFN